LQVHHPTTAQL
jgi:WD40 repeat protein